MDNCIKQMCCNQFGERDAIQNKIDDLETELRIAKNQLGVKDEIIAENRIALSNMIQSNDDLEMALKSYKQMYEAEKEINNQLIHKLGILESVNNKETPSKDN